MRVALDKDMPPRHVRWGDSGLRLEVAAVGPTLVKVYRDGESNVRIEHGPDPGPPGQAACGPVLKAPNGMSAGQIDESGRQMRAGGHRSRLTTVTRRKERRSRSTESLSLLRKPRVRPTTARQRSSAARRANRRQQRSLPPRPLRRDRRAQKFSALRPPLHPLLTVVAPTAPVIRWRSPTLRRPPP